MKLTNKILKALYEIKNLNEEQTLNIPANWKLNKDGSYDVDGNVHLDKSFVDSNGKLKVKFNKVKFRFDCFAIGLKSLEGCPKEVGSDFDCEDNELTSLEGGPSKVYGMYNCSWNKLTNLEGSASTVGSFDCSHNKLTSLKGAPKTVKRDFNCSYNKTLKSLEGCPKKVGEDFIAYISDYDRVFSEDEIAKVCKVGGEILE